MRWKDRGRVRHRVDSDVLSMACPHQEQRQEWAHPPQERSRVRGQEWSQSQWTQPGLGYGLSSREHISYTERPWEGGTRDDHFEDDNTLFSSGSEDKLGRHRISMGGGRTFRKGSSGFRSRSASQSAEDNQLLG